MSFVDKAFLVIIIMDINTAEPHATELIFLTPVPAKKMQLFHTKYYALHTTEA